MKIRNRNSEKGFALALALMMLLVMSIMGATLMSVVSNDHKSNGLKDTKSQFFFAEKRPVPPRNFLFKCLFKEFN